MLEKKNLDYEKVVLVGIINQQQNEEKSKEYLDELEFLTYTAGGEVFKNFYWYRKNGRVSSIH